MDTPILLGPTRKKARIEIIPLIDVIFFLLATFVLFTLSLDVIKSMTVVLPVAGPAGLDNKVSLQASEAGNFYWREGEQPAEMITISEIKPRLEAYKNRTANPRVIVRGDRKAKFGVAIQAFDAAREVGIKQVSIETIVSTTGN
jgi:biopolymer transport protein ExbD